MYRVEWLHIIGFHLGIQLRNPFELLADGVAREKELIDKKASEEARNEIWLLR